MAIYIRKNEEVPGACQELFNNDFISTSDVELVNNGWLSVNQNFGLTSNGGRGLHWVDYTTDRPAQIELPITTSLKGKKIKFSIQWQIGTYTRWGGGSFEIKTINNSGTGVKDQYTSGFNLCSFPFYVSGTDGGQYSGMGTGGRRYTDTPGGSSTGINGDQDGTVYMKTYGNTHLGLGYGAGVWKAEGEYDLSNMTYTCTFTTIISGTITTSTFTRTFNTATSEQLSKMEDILDGNYGALYVTLNNGRGFGMSSYDTNYITYASVEVCENTTVVCDFKADGTGTTSLNNLMVLGDFVGQRSGNTSISAGNNGSLRLSIPATDYAAIISLGGGDAWGTAVTNLGYSNGCANSSRLRQNLIKKAYLKISALYDSGYGASGAYPIFNRGGVCVGFNKKKVSSNWAPREGTSNGCTAGFAFPRGDYSTRSSYIVHPIDANTQYLALPTTENLGENHTATGYIDQGTSCLYSRLTLETRGSDPSNFHYWLIVGATGNEYDLGLCSSLGSCTMYVNCGDWRKNGSYKEIEEAYIEYFDGYYIDEDGNITTTKPW